MKKILSLAFLFLFITSYADAIDDGNHQYYGKIISLNKNSVIIKLDGTGDNRMFKWRDIVSVKFNNQYTHPAWGDVSSSPVTAQFSCVTIFVFEVKFQNLTSSCYADDLSINNGILHITYSNGKGTVDLPYINLYELVDWIFYEEICPNSIPAQFPIKTN